MLCRILAPLALVLALAVATSGAHAQGSAPCQFILGFKALHDLDPADVGACLDNQAFAANGDAVQHTTKGLMAWRKADNWTAFTNGDQTWINGPKGLARRPNTKRFGWEGDAFAYLLADPPAGYVPRRYLPTGTFLRDADRSGLGELKIDNGQDLDAVGVIATPSGQPLVSVYLRAGDSFTVKGIPDGTYSLFFTLGTDWDSGAASFTRDASFQRFADPMVYATTGSPGAGGEYTTYSVTFYKVAGGTASTPPVAPGQFPHP